MADMIADGGEKQERHADKLKIQEDQESKKDAGDTAVNLFSQKSPSPHANTPKHDNLRCTPVWMEFVKWNRREAPTAVGERSHEAELEEHRSNFLREQQLGPRTRQSCKRERGGGRERERKRERERERETGRERKDNQNAQPDRSRGARSIGGHEPLHRVN